MVKRRSAIKFEGTKIPKGFNWRTKYEHSLVEILDINGPRPSCSIPHDPRENFCPLKLHHPICVSHPPLSTSPPKTKKERTQALFFRLFFSGAREEDGGLNRRRARVFLSFPFSPFNILRPRFHSSCFHSITCSKKMEHDHATGTTSTTLTFWSQIPPHPSPRSIFPPPIELFRVCSAIVQAPPVFPPNLGDSKPL